MTRRLAQTGIIGCLLLYLRPVVWAQTVVLPPAELTSAVQMELEKIVCSRYDVSSQAISGYYLHSGRLGARVRCKPHRAINEHLIFAETQCDSHRRWTCDDPWLNVTFSATGQPHAVRLSSVQPEECIAILKYLSTLPPYPGGRFASKELEKVWLLERSDPGSYTI